MKRIKQLFKPYSRALDDGIIRSIPVKTRGKLFVSPMPYGAYDTGNRLMGLYKQNRIAHVFILAQDSEIKTKARRDIKKEYGKIGATYSQYPFVDMTAPDFDTLVELVDRAQVELKSHNVVIHCHAGVGRTSVGACCVIQVVEGKGPADSITYVKKHMEVNMTAEQQSTVMKFQAKLKQRESCV